MTIEEHYRKLERLYGSAPVNEHYKPIMHISDGCAEVTIPVQRGLFHAANAVHGELYFKCLDDATFFAVSSLVDDVFVLTVSFNLYLTRPISAGEMRATGRVVYRSRQLFVAEAELMDQDGRELGRGSGTFMRSAIPLSPEIGYK